MKDANCSKNLECSPPQSKKYSSTTCSEIHMRKVSGGDSSLSEFSHPASGKAACDRRFSHTHKNAHTHTHTHTLVCIQVTRTLINPLASICLVLSDHTFALFIKVKVFNTSASFVFLAIFPSFLWSVWPQRTAAGLSVLSPPFVVPRPSHCSSVRTLPPQQSQLPSTLSNTKQTHTHTRTHKPSHVHRRWCAG